jgi:hypothetical protein
LENGTSDGSGAPGANVGVPAGGSVVVVDPAAVVDGASVTGVRVDSVLLDPPQAARADPPAMTAARRKA